MAQQQATLKSPKLTGTIKRKVQPALLCTIYDMVHGFSSFKS